MFEATKEERQSRAVVRSGAWGKYLSMRVFDILRNSGIPCELTLRTGAQRDLAKRCRNSRLF